MRAKRGTRSGSRGGNRVVQIGQDVLVTHLGVVRLGERELGSLPA
jgi:hypothetical protein